MQKFGYHWENDWDYCEPGWFIRPFVLSLSLGSGRYAALRLIVLGVGVYVDTWASA